MDKFANLPSPLKWILGVTGLGALVGVGGVAGSGNWKLLLLYIVILGALLLITVGTFMLFGMIKRKKQSARLGSEINQSTTASPRGMSATDLARLDSMRKKFQEGVEAFRSRGKDLYALPWYVIIGEPGSGKTEAVRHCNVGFPPGMHEGDNSVGYMGAGGTINMNWWFTNQAVMLDTAGRLIFEEIKPGETSEWREFLKLLKKNRPNCPVNGLLLVVPSDSLIKDSADQIAAKAGKIAQQLDVIQRILDFRFPVYVIITKSDKINGFREFFENLTDPQLQHQIMGWSNPEPLDSPFRPDSVDKHLSSVAERLRRRRLGLLRDPVPENAARRTDEVDSQFVLPNSLLMLAPRLRRYLETIFMPGEWSAKPLFLRGIYFTSAMREGAALDQELAEAIGVSADELPEGKVWERDRAYFLRDLFIEKVFCEKGLVTRATNVKARLHRNHLILYSSTLVALVIFIGVAWFGIRTVRSRVKERSDYWSFASNVKWTDGAWNYAIIRPDENTGVYQPVTKPVKFAGDELTPGQVQSKLRELAENEIKGRWTTPGLAGIYNDNSKRAQRVMFETGVLRPIMSAVAQRMRDTKTDTQQPHLTDTLVDLVHLESDILSRRKGDDVPLDSREALNVLKPLWSFAVGGETPALDSNLVPVMVWTYNNNKYGSAKWPPAWLSTTTVNAKGTNNPVIAAGLDYFIQQATNTVQYAGTNWGQVTNIAASLSTFDKAENNYVAAIPDPGKMGQTFTALKVEHDRFTALTAAAANNVLVKGHLSLLGAFQSYTNQVVTYGMAAFARLEAQDLEALQKHPGYPVFQMVSRRLQAQRSAFSSGLANLLSPDEMREFKRLDDQCLAAKNGIPAVEQRWRVYEGIQNFSGIAGFPLLRDAKNSMTPDAVTQATRLLGSILAGVNSEAIQQVTGNNNGDWKTLTNRLVELQRISGVLETKERPIFCTVSLLKMDDQSRADDAWRSKYRYIKLAGDSTKMENTNVGQDEELGKVTLSKSCNFQLYQRDDDKEPGQTESQNDWGAVALAIKYGQPATDGDFTTWIVKRPVEGSSGSLRLRLKFDEPLVALDQWPKE